MNKTILWTVVAIVIVALAIIVGRWIVQERSFQPLAQPATTAGTGSQAPLPSSTPTTTGGTKPPLPSSGGTTTTLPAPITVNVTGGEFFFQPNVITVKKGQTVTIHFVNQKGFHNWVIDAFNASTPTIGAGQTADVTFAASKSGSFEYYCSVGNHRALGMRGTLIVQ